MPSAVSAEKVGAGERPSYPHVQAAFINAIREEGTKTEACDWLQKTWNELCAVRAAYHPERDALLVEAVEDLEQAREYLERFGVHPALDKKYKYHTDIYICKALARLRATQAEASA